MSATSSEPRNWRKRAPDRESRTRPHHGYEFASPFPDSGNETRVRAPIPRLCLGALVALLATSCELTALGPAPVSPDAPRECGDGLDNDGDGRADYPDDPGCESAIDPQEAPLAVPRACSDGLDNDGDGRIDFDRDGDGMLDADEDPGCDGAADDDELNVVLPACGDGVDNDRDGRTDFPADPQCTSRNDSDESS
jgi:hypothetical protein